MLVTIRRHAFILSLALHSAAGRPDSFAGTTTVRASPTLNRTQPIANRSCQASCVYTVPSVSYNWWDPVSITETVTAETIVTVINRKKNTTSFSTVSNPSWDPSKHPKPTDLNSDGTRTAVITDMAPFGSSSTTFTLTFPTIYLSYPPTYTVSGQIPTSIDGESTCATFTGDEGTVLPWPSHPTISPTAPIIDGSRFEQDPRGWSWVFRNRDAFASDAYSNASLPEKDRHQGQWWLRPFFPNLPLWDCSAGVDLDSPYAVEAKTALFLTGSSTAFEDGDDDDAHDETTSPEMSASEVTASPTAPVSVAAAPVLIPSSTDLTSGPKIAPSATPANAVSDQLPVQTTNAPQTALGSPATNSNGAAATLQEGGSIGNQGGPSVNTMGKGASVSSTDAAIVGSSPSPKTIESVLATPFVMLPGSQSLILSLGGSETTLGMQTSGASRSFEFASQVIAVDSQGQYQIGGQTLSLNQAVTAAEAPTELDKGVSGSSMPQSANAGSSGGIAPSSTTFPPALIVGSQTIKPNAKGNYILQSQTLTTDTAGRLIVGGATLAPGSAVTVSGTPISLSPEQRTAGVGATSEQTGLGPAIMGGFGEGAPSSLSNAIASGTGTGSAVAPVAFTGGARRVGKGMFCELVMLGLVVTGVVRMV